VVPIFAEKIKLFVKRTDEYFLNSKGGCLLGNLALEVSSENLEFKEIIKEYFTAWENSLFNILKNKYEDSKARIMSKEYVALIQGSIMMMNLYDDTYNYLQVGEKLISLI
jgi:hypothetical protein